MSGCAGRLRPLPVPGEARSSGLTRVPLALACIVLMLGCQPKPISPAADGKSAALRLMEQVAIAAHRCWFASKDPAFRSYRFANELNSMSGQPRFLLVPARNFGGLPSLVVQARTPTAELESFGPLLQEPLGSRVQGDLKRWAGGSSSCTAQA